MEKTVRIIIVTITKNILNNMLPLTLILYINKANAPPFINIMKKVSYICFFQENIAKKSF